MNIPAVYRPETLTLWRNEAEDCFGIGGDESSPDEEEEDSTLKCSGTAWSGSDSATHHRSSSTSDFSSSASEEEENDEADHPSHITSRPSEGVHFLAYTVTSKSTKYNFHQLTLY